ncbi:MAG: tRNA(His) guanylyltransferase Thg1 family protein, partial [Polyangiaceae bacterium]
MKMDDFAASMRAREVTSNLRLDEGTWTVVRVDGRGFSRLTATHFDKPFDARFSEAMVSTARGLMEEMQGLLAYTQSDEISLVLPPHFDAFDRRI